MLRLVLVPLLVILTTSSISGDDDNIASHEDAFHHSADFREENEHNALFEEFPNRADTPTEYIDPSDIFNYDPVTRTMRNGKEPRSVIDMTLLEQCRMDLVQCRQNLMDYHEKTLVNTMYDKHEAIDKIGGCKKELKSCHDDVSDCKLGCSTMATSNRDSSVDSPCHVEQMFFRRFAKRFISLLIAEEELDTLPLAAEVRVELHHHGWSKLRQFVQQKGKLKLVDAHDLMSDMLVSAHHDNGTGSRTWLERLTGMESTDIKFYVLLLTLSIIVVVFESKTKTSWWQQACAVVAVIFIISLFWNWLYLYKKELAKRLAEVHKLEDNLMPANCRPGKMTWWESLSEVFRNQFTFQDDPCASYHEKYLVDPIYEVPPTRAFSHTISIMLFEPLKYLGASLADFHRELLKDLPYQAWIPALLSPYLIIFTVAVVLCYCPRRGQRRDQAAWERVHMLEAQLREQRAINQRRDRIEALEMPHQDPYAARQQAPSLPPQVNPVRDVNRPLWDIPQGRHQRQAHNEYFEEPAAGDRPQARGRRRQRGSSESDIQHRQQRPLRDVAALGSQSTPYHGDVSDDYDSSDEKDGHRQQQSHALNKQRSALVSSSQASSSQVGTRSMVPATSESRTSVIQGQPVESPHSEVDSMDGVPAVRTKIPTNTGRAISAKARGESSAYIGTGQVQKVKGGQDRDDPGRHGALDERGAAGEANVEDKESKIKTDRSKSRVAVQKAPTTLTPSSSTDSEPFLASPQGCDSPSSVSIIEGDSSPVSGGSIDGDSHLQGLGVSLSGSIDIIGSLEIQEGVRADSEGGPDSDEFEVLSREQCQTETM